MMALGWNFTFRVRQDSLDLDISADKPVPTFQKFPVILKQIEIIFHLQPNFKSSSINKKN
jgi:hypothetical protein